jgi:hypothetical protein
LNLRPSGYEPDELPGCSTPRRWRRVGGVLWAPGSRTLGSGPGRGSGAGAGGRVLGGIGEPGGDLLFRRLSGSTIGAEGFHGRVRDGIGCLAPRCGHQAGQAPLGLQPRHTARALSPPRRVCALDVAEVMPLGGWPGGICAGGICEGGGEVSGGRRRARPDGRLPLHAGGFPAGSDWRRIQHLDRAGSSD